MAMEANAASMPAVKPLQRPQSAGNTGVVSRSNEGTAGSPFAPQTNVSIKNSIADMAGILAKISSNENLAADEIPQQVQKMIQNVLSSAFSLDATLSEGLGSTMESQRFSLEQLTTLSRIISQMGTLAENGAMDGLSDSLQALLQNFKSYVGDSNSFEPVLLNKQAFQLLDTKTMADLPQELQLLLGQLAGTVSNLQQFAPSQTETLGFMKQLIQYFMPTAQSSSTGEAVTQQLGSSAQNTAAHTGAAANGTANGSTSAGTSNSAGGRMPTTATGKMVNTSAQLSEKATNLSGTALEAADGSASGQEGNISLQQGKAGTSATNGCPQVMSETTGQPTAQQTTAGTAESAESPAAAGQRNGTTAGTLAGRTVSAETAGENTVTQENSMPAAGGREAFPTGTASRGVPAGTNPAGQEVNGKSTEAALKGNPTGQSATGQAAAASNGLPLENTVQTMDTMKNLASLLLKDAALTEKDTALLQNFVNGKQTALPEKDAKQLQLLLRLCQHNMPAAVQQVANQSNMEGLPKIWAFMQLCELTSLKDLKSQDLKKAGKRLSEFTSSIKHSMGGENSTVEGQRSMSFMMPLYMGDNKKSFPAYIHVYDEEKQNEASDTPQKETWLRLCVLTDNIGAVELTCRLYEGQKLDLRVFFSDPEVVKDFQEYVPELRDNINGSSMELQDFKVGAAGGRL